MRYSNDLRLKVIELIKSNKRQIDVARLLSIDKSTIYRWYRRYKETGSVDAKSYLSATILSRPKPYRKKWSQIKSLYKKLTHSFENKIELIEFVLNYKYAQLI